MHQTSLLFRIKQSPVLDNSRLLELFFRAWVDNTCNNEVNFEVRHELHKSIPGSSETPLETVRVDFGRIEDAVILKLKGIPAELQNYIEIIE